MAIARNALTGHLDALTAEERFTLVVEALARKDEREARALEASCPRRLYHMDDAAYLDRMRRAFAITSTVCLDLAEGLAEVRAAERLSELAEVLVRAWSQAEAATPGLGAPEAVRELAEINTFLVGKRHASELLTRWEGFRRFCRGTLGLEPGAMLAAFGSRREDLADVVRSVYPEAEADESRAEQWAARWERCWHHRS